jgi:hypothetical protein
MAPSRGDGASTSGSSGPDRSRTSGEKHAGPSGVTSGRSDRSPGVAGAATSRDRYEVLVIRDFNCRLSVGSSHQRTNDQDGQAEYQRIRHRVAKADN